MPSLARHLRAERPYLLALLLLVIALYVVVPQFGSFRASWHLLGHPLAGWTAAAIGLTGLTYFAGSLTYCLLADKPLPYRQTVLVELAAMFVNRLLPAGVGALGVNFTYLRRLKHSNAQATAIVAINNTLGFVGHGLVLLLTLVLVSSRQAGQLHWRPMSLHWEASLLIGCLAVVVLFVAARYFRRSVAELLRQFASYRHRLGRLGGALLSSMLLTLCNVLCFACCALALGVHLPFLAALLIFSFGVGAGTAVPTPGGLGGFEAGLTAGLIALQVSSSEALAVALLYRFISYWLPLLAGGPALILVQKRHLLKLS